MTTKDLNHSSKAIGLITQLQKEFDLPFEEARWASLYALELAGVNASKDHRGENNELKIKNKT